MKANIVITLDGQINIITQEGTFEAGAGQIRRLLAELAGQGLTISLDGQIEQHRHDHPDQVDAGPTHAH